MHIPPGPLTKTIAVLNIAVAVLMLLPGVWDIAAIAGALFPARFMQGDAAFGSAFVLPVWLTPISSAFLHGGLLHVALNMLMLLMVGPNIERILGLKGFGLLYFAGMIAAAVAEIAANSTSMIPVVGASGAISALLATHMQLFPQDRPEPVGPLSGKVVHALKLMLGWGVLNVMLGFVGPSIGVTIAIWAHIGGFAAGLLLTWPLLSWRYRDA